MVHLQSKAEEVYILKKVIFDQRELIKNIDIVEREIELEPQANYIVVGLRRSGKS